MDRYICKVCATIYDPGLGEPEEGILPGTPFDQIPEDWKCVVCGAGKSNFELLSEERYQTIMTKRRSL